MTVGVRLPARVLRPGDLLRHPQGADVGEAGAVARGPRSVPRRDPQRAARGARHDRAGVGLDARTIGARMIVRADGSSFGTIGGGAFEAMVVVRREGAPRSRAPAPTLKRYTFTEEGENALGMACGGTAEVLLEAAERGARLIIFGAGHVGLALARLAGDGGVRPRARRRPREFCEAARDAPVGRVLALRRGRTSTGVPPLDPGCYVAVVTRCHRTDRLALKRVLGRPLRYVGSDRKPPQEGGHLRRARRARTASPPTSSTRVRCPIGLPLGGETPRRSRSRSSPSCSRSSTG